MKQKTFTAVTVAILAIASFTANGQTPAGTAWKITGNTGTLVTSNFLGTTDYKALAFRTNNLDRMRLSKDGNLGIGITSPAEALLNVAYTTSVSLSSPGSMLVGSTNSTNLAFDGNEVQARYNGAGNTLYLNYWGGSAWMGNHSGTAIPGVFVNSNGAVGIGSSVTNSAYALSINPVNAGNGIQINDPVDGVMVFGIKSGSGTGLLIENSSSSNGSPAVYGSNSGGGWGVYGYSANFYGMEGYSSNSVGVYGYNSSGNASGVYGWSAGGSGSNGVWGYCAGTGHGAEGYCVDGSGVYGYSANYIGVFGQTGNSSSYAGYFSGDVYTSGTYSSSDQKLKQNIQDFSSAMNIINQLHPKQYVFRQDGDYKLMNLPQGQHYGLIAQDVEKVLPNLVKDSKFDTKMAQTASPINPGDPNAKTQQIQKNQQAQQKSDVIDFKALNYTELIPIIIKGMQEQQQQIDELKQTVQALSGNADRSSINSSSLSAGSVRLDQNTPNPFSQNTVIRCYIPSTVHQAQLIVYSTAGRQIQSFTLNNKGTNEVTINAGTLSSGQYTYTLFADGKNVDSKNMILTK